MNQSTTTFADRPSQTWADVSLHPVTKASRASSSRCDSEPMEKVEQTIGYMMDHLDQPLQVATLAAMACVSPSHYFALFKRRTGCAPMDYFTRLRMERARALLETTRGSIKEVAAELGYEDPFYFSRVFKAVNRLAPTYYRQQRAGDALPLGSKEDPPCESAVRPLLQAQMER